MLGLARVERRERLAELGLALEPDAGREPVGGERAGDVAEQLQRLLGLAALVQDAGERDGGVGAAGLELQRPPQGGLVARLDQRVGLGGEQVVEELLDARRRLGADELGHDAGVLEGLDRGDALDPEGGGDLGIGVGVELGECDLALALGHQALEHRRELAARTAPLGPEVDDHGQRARALDDVLLERRL